MPWWWWDVSAAIPDVEGLVMHWWRRVSHAAVTKVFGIVEVLSPVRCWPGIIKRTLTERHPATAAEWHHVGWLHSHFNKLRSAGAAKWQVVGHGA